MLAASEGHKAIVKLLLDTGTTGKVDFLLANKHGETPLSRAAEHGHEDIVKLLSDAGKADAVNV